MKSVIIQDQWRYRVIHIHGHQVNYSFSIFFKLNVLKSFQKMAYNLTCKLCTCQHEQRVIVVTMKLESNKEDLNVVSEDAFAADSIPRNKILLVSVQKHLEYLDLTFPQSLHDQCRDCSSGRVMYGIQEKL